MTSHKTHKKGISIYAGKQCAETYQYYDEQSKKYRCMNEHCQTRRTFNIIDLRPNLHVCRVCACEWDSDLHLVIKEGRKLTAQERSEKC